MKILSPFFLFILFQFYYNSTNCQVAETNSLQKQLLVTTDSIKYTDILNRLATLFYEINADSTYYYAVKANDIARRLDYLKGEADAANNMGVLHDLRGSSQEALRYYNAAFNRYKKLGDVSNMVQTIMNVAIVYYEMDKTSKTLSYFKVAFALGKKLKKDSIMSFVYANYISCFSDQIPKDSVSFYINKSKYIATKYNDTRMVIFADQLTAENMIANHQIKEATTILESTLQKALQNRLNYSVTDIYIDLANISTDSATAVNYYNQALNISEKSGFKAGIRYTYQNMYDFYSAKKNYKTSLLYADKLFNFYNDQKNTDSNSAIDYIDYALKDQALSASLNQSKYQQRLLILLAGLCLASIVFIIILWRNTKKVKRTANALKLQFAQAESTTESLDKLNKNYSRVIKMVAHDLRSPISSINMLSTLMEPETMQPKELKEFAEIITSVSKNCFELIDQLLHSDLEEEQHLKKSEIELDELLNQCVFLLNFKAKEKNQEIIFTDQQKIKLYGDSDKLTRVINNLIMNAIKFSPENTTIQVKVFYKENDVVIAVIDNGIGIPVNLQSIVFDPFTHAKRKGTKGETTFGLGLYTSKRIVEAHGGIIWFNSLPEKGTAFYVQLPVLKNYIENSSLSNILNVAEK